MKNLRLMAIVAATVIVFTSCEEKDEKPSKKSMLTRKSWMMTAETVSPAIVWEDGSQTTNMYEDIYEECERDNLMKLKSDGTFKEDEGDEECEESDLKTGTWELEEEDDKTTLSITIDEETDDFKILKLDQTTLKLQHKEKYNGVNYTITTTLKAQD